ncbi:MAG: Ig-like domain-containing protein [Dysgonomonas sp.]
MKIYLKVLPVLISVLCLQFMSCDDEIEYVDSTKPQSIKIVDVANNTIGVYTTATYQLEMAVIPQNAEVEEPITFVYKSSDTDVFTVSATGLITGIGVGEAVLNVTTEQYPDLRTMAVVKITDEYFNVTSIEIDSKYKDYSMALGEILDLSPFITVKPDNASNPSLTFTSSDEEVVTVSEDGVIEAKKLGTATIKIVPTDGSPVSVECKISVKEVVYTHLDRASWVITPSHKLPTDAAISNAPESLLDDKTTTCLSMVKPGKSYEGIKIEADEEVFFVVDMKAEATFDYLKLDHRSNNSYAYLRPYALSIFGSNDGSTFTPILENAPAQYEEANYIVHLPAEAKYRYVKVQYTDWDKKSGSTVQLSELNIGKKSF